MVADMGFKGCITEGAKHILGWKSPNYLYCSTAVPKLKLLLKNYKMSDDITFRFSNYEWSEYPLTADKYMLDQCDSRDRAGGEPFYELRNVGRVAAS